MEATNYVYKRKSPRRRLSRKAGALHQGEFFSAMVVEIGEGGMLLALDKSIAVNDQLVVSFSIPAENLVSVRAEVRYERKDPRKQDAVLIGLQFVNLSKEYSRKIRSYISSKSLLEAEQERKELKNDKAQIYSFSKDQEGRAKPTVL